MPGIDVSKEGCGRTLVNQLGMLGGGGGMSEGGVRGLDVVVSLGLIYFVFSIFYFLFSRGNGGRRERDGVDVNWG